MANVKPPGKTRLLAESLIHVAMRILRDNGKEMPIRDVMARVEKEVQPAMIMLKYSVGLCHALGGAKSVIFPEDTFTGQLNNRSRIVESDRERQV